MTALEEHELQNVDNKTQEDLDGDDQYDEEPRKHVSQYLNVQSHWGLPRLPENILFYSMAILGWLCLIAAAALGSYKHTSSRAFQGTFITGAVLHWAAWFQTVFAMVQRASWRREETLVERSQFLFFGIRLQRLMIPTAIICFVTFLQAYVRRHELHDLPYWLLFLLMFILNTVFSVMNAYNNITWEADRLYYDDNLDGIPKVLFAILGI